MFLSMLAEGFFKMIFPKWWQIPLLIVLIALIGFYVWWKKKQV